jgi:translation elongation factor EF-Tu-like GTPase
MFKAIVAQVHWLPPEEGGRRSDIYSGYRPTCWFGLRTESGEKHYNDVHVYFYDRDSIPPGEDHTVRLEPLAPELVAEAAKVGLEFDVTEGRRVVGRGTIREIVEEGL